MITEWEKGIYIIKAVIGKEELDENIVKLKEGVLNIAKIIAQKCNVSAISVLVRYKHINIRVGQE